MIWYLKEGWGIPFIQFLVADTVFPGLPFCDMDLTRCTAREFTARLMGEDEVWVPEAQLAWLPCQAQQSVRRELPRPGQGQDSNIWSAESEGMFSQSALP